MVLAAGACAWPGKAKPSAETKQAARAKWGRFFIFKILVQSTLSAAGNNISEIKKFDRPSQSTLDLLPKSPLWQRRHSEGKVRPEESLDAKGILHSLRLPQNDDNSDLST
jgi:hypothetical protein